MSTQATRSNTTEQVDPQEWTQAFAAQSAEKFGEAFAQDVVLETAMLYRPVQGRDQVARAMAQASKIYESLVFIRHAVNGPHTYLEWELTALGGIQARGVTVLTKNEDDKITHVAIHHRPLGALLTLSAEFGRRLTGVLDPSYLHHDS